MIKKMSKKILALFMTFAMVISLLPAVTLTVSAADATGTITTSEPWTKVLNTLYEGCPFNVDDAANVYFDNLTTDGGDTESAQIYLNDSPMIIGHAGGTSCDGTETVKFTASVAGKYSFEVYSSDDVVKKTVTITVTAAIAAPTVSTTAVTAYTTTTATMGGNVTADGGAAVTERGVVYSTTDQTPTIAEGATKNTNGNGTGAFSVPVTGLTAGTKYYVRAYATNSVNTSYGTMVEFTTTAANTAPSFVGSSTLSVDANSSATDIKSILHVRDTDSGQTLTWTVSVAPSNGVFSSFAGATASSGGIDIAPGGTLTYTPNPGYSGNDNFVVEVSDGITSSILATSITVKSTTDIVTEHFSDEVTGTPVFTNSDFSFNLQGGNFKIANIDTYGWTGTAVDAYYVDNVDHILTSTGIVGSIQIASGTFRAHSIYVFPGENNLEVKNTGTVIIRGKLSGDTKFTRTVASNEINLSSLTDNGYTFVDLSAYNTIAIDTLEFELTGALRYLAIDAFKHESTALASSDAGLSSVAAQAITAGLQDGTIGAPKTASINVVNAKATIGLTDISAATSATFNLYSDSGFSSEITGAGTIALTSGSATTIYIKVTAQDTTTVKYYAVTVNRAPAPSTVTTQAVSSIAATTATGNGNITSLGVPNPTAHGVCWNTTGTPTTANSKVDNGAASAVGAFTAAMTGLTANTTYYVRAYATNTAGTSYGTEVSFTTSAVVPTATTDGASLISSTAATLNGSINANNASTTVTFEYGTTTSYGSSATAAQSPVTGTSATAVSCALTGLTPNTTYHFRVKSVNAAGTAYGDDTTFTTSAVAPTVTTGAASATSSTGATLNGTVNANNASSVVTFEYGTSTSYGSSATAAQSPVTGTSATAVSCALTGLTPNTTYHFRVKSVNTSGTTYGNDTTFTTPATVPDAPTSVSVTAGDGQASVSFSAPSLDGGSPISSYTVTATPVTGSAVTKTDSASPITVTGLTNGIVYTFTVTATNSVGTGAASSASSGITPFTNSTLSSASAGFDKYANATNYKDILITMTLNGNTLSDIKNGASTLVAGKDYEVVGNTCTIKKEYLKTQSTGAINLTFDFSLGVDPNLAITVADTTPVTSGGGDTTSGSAVVEINGEKQDAGTSNTQNTGGQTVTTIKVDDTKLDKILESKGNNATVTLPASGNSDVVVGELNGQTVKNMEAKEAVLEIKTGTVSYTLPASQINIDSVSSQLGSQVALKDIKVSVKIAEPPADTVKIVENTASKGNYQIVVKPVDFEITCTSGDKTVLVSKFNGYVERTVAIPDGVDPSKITTGIVLNADGTFSHVPTQIFKIDGKYFAKINSLTNSTYSVIWNPVIFTDVSSHWAKNAINDMGSRMVVTGMGNGTYEPDRSITRAEFAAIVVRAMGLKQGTTESAFEDVSLTDWYNGYVDTAAEYRLITGYDSTAFVPYTAITREQAMTILARAMKLTGLSASLTDSETSAILSKYTDGALVSGYAKTSVALCIKTGVVTGSSATTLSPEAYVTRAEVAVMVQRLLQKSGLI